MNMLDKIKDSINKTDALEQSEIVSKAKAGLASTTKKQTNFPLDAFHPKISMVIESLQKSYPFPTDWFGLGIMSVASTVIGNSYGIEYQKGWNCVPIIYGLMVGNSGSGKSPLIKLLTKPLKQIEKNYYEDYLEERRAWKEECEIIENANLKQKQQQALPIEPKSQRIITNDATLESLFQVVQQNPKGIILLRQELIGWIKSMNQYRGGSDGEFWLEAWDNEDFLVDRVKRSFKLNKVYINVLGGIQQQILGELAKDSRLNNGFIPRLLFAYPSDLRTSPPSLQPVNLQAIDAYHDVINFLKKLPNKIEVKDKEINYFNVETFYIPLDEEAKTAYYNFLVENNDKKNVAEEDIERSILSKMENNLLRFALLIFLTDMACSKNVLVDMPFMEKQTIGANYIRRAIQLVHYFTQTSYKVIQKIESPVESLKAHEREWYLALPETVATALAVSTGKQLGISRSTVNRILRNEKGKIFEKKAQGIFDKIYLQ